MTDRLTGPISTTAPPLELLPEGDSSRSLRFDSRTHEELGRE